MIDVARPHKHPRKRLGPWFPYGEPPVIERVRRFLASNRRGCTASRIAREVGAVMSEVHEALAVLVAHGAVASHEVDYVRFFFAPVANPELREQLEQNNTREALSAATKNGSAKPTPETFKGLDELRSVLLSASSRIDEEIAKRKQDERDCLSAMGERDGLKEQLAVLRKKHDELQAKFNAQAAELKERIEAHQVVKEFAAKLERELEEAKKRTPNAEVEKLRAEAVTLRARVESLGQFCKHCGRSHETGKVPS